MNDVVERLSEQIDAEIMRLLCPPQPKRNTALAMRGGAFVTIEFDDAGNEIVPPARCPKCGPILMCAKHMAMVG